MRLTVRNSAAVADPDRAVLYRDAPGGRPTLDPTSTDRVAMSIWETESPPVLVIQA